MARTFVVGDIHGCAASLQDLLRRIDPDPVEDTLVFLGDYLDRGPQSAQVLEQLLQLRARHQRMVTLMGNHEQMFLDFLQGVHVEYFFHLGGVATLLSYGMDPARYRDQFFRLPQAHVNFLRELQFSWEDRHAIYVHAGLQPGRHLSQQQADWCLWVRDKFINSSCDFGKPVIFGHTVFPAPLIQANKIGIDTGAVYGGSLTCLVLPEREFIQVPGERGTPCTLAI